MPHIQVLKYDDITTPKIGLVGKLKSLLPTRPSPGVKMTEISRPVFRHIT